LGRIILAGFSVAVITLLITLAWFSRDLPTPAGIMNRAVPQSTKIYDRTGQTVLYNIHGEERRTVVNFNAFPDFLKQATLTAEDRNFYQHRGFRLTSMLRAVIVNMVSGARVQGGSTITQQFIKKAILGDEKSYIRKIKEIFLAYQIEQRFSKDEILKLYLNEIPYGSNAYGAEAATQLFFGKSAKDLSLAEAAILASLVKAPSYYSPWGIHIDELINRQHYILDGMAAQGYITTDQAEAAKQANLEFQPNREAIIAPHFVFYVKEQLADIYSERMVEQGGLKIITSLDIRMQKLAEDSITESLPLLKRYQANNASLVAIDPATGQILAMAGSADYFNNDIQGQVNVALRPRQPGSSFKPIAYATALAAGFAPQTIIYDVTTDFKTDTGVYTPSNYDGQERGPVDLRHALAGSLNIPAVKFLYLTGINKVLDLADKLGYTTLKERSRFGLSLVLGGAEVNLLEHTNAFAVFAREGVFKPTISIIKVEDGQGRTLQEFRDTTGERVINEQPVRNLTNILSDNEARSFIFGNQNRLTLADRPVAAKTGTTNEYRDAWTMGYTPQLAVGVWVGNNNNRAMSKGADGSVVAAPIWQRFFSQAVKQLPIQYFIPPEPITPDKPMLNGDLGGQTVMIDKVSGLLATDLTPIQLREQKTFRQYHTILQYVTPGDPQGPTPTNPANDPQYSLWEGAVKNWTHQQGLKDEFPPVDYDNLHTTNNQPRVFVASPVNNEVISTNSYQFSSQITSFYTIKKVDYWIDNILVKTLNSPPYATTLQLGDFINSGFHQLRVVADDEVGNTGEASVNFNFLSAWPSDAPNTSFIYPLNGSLLNLSTWPLIIKINNQRPEKLKQLDLYYSINNSPSQWLGVIPSPQTNNTFVWNKSVVGKITFSLVLTANTGTAQFGPWVEFKVSP